MKQAFSQEQFAATRKANIDTLMSLADTAVSNAERLTALNLKLAREAIQDTGTSAKNLCSAQAIEELLSLPTTQPKKMLDQMSTYFHCVRDISGASQKVFSHLMEAQLANMNSSVFATLDEIAKSGPAGSEVAASAFKSALAAATSAYGNLSKTAQEVAELAEAQVTAVADATTQAISTPADNPSKKAA